MPRGRRYCSPITVADVSEACRFLTFSKAMLRLSECSESVRPWVQLPPWCTWWWVPLRKKQPPTMSSIPRSLQAWIRASRVACLASPWPSKQGCLGPVLGQARVQVTSGRILSLSHLSSRLTTLLVPGESQSFQSQHPARARGQECVPRSPCHLLPSPR